MAETKKSRTLGEKILHQSSVLTRTKAFKKLTSWAFKQMDKNNSGTVTKNELYTGHLMIHLYLARYAGAAACKPMPREKLDDIFDSMDDDRSGMIDENEFTEIMMVISSQIATRITIQYSITILLIPYVAQFILDWLVGSKGLFGMLFSSVVPGFILALLPTWLVETLPLSIVQSILFLLILPGALDLIDETFMDFAANANTTTITTVGEVEEENKQD